MDKDALDEMRDIVMFLRRKGVVTTLSDLATEAMVDVVLKYRAMAGIKRFPRRRRQLPTGGRAFMGKESGGAARALGGQEHRGIGEAGGSR